MRGTKTPKYNKSQNRTCISIYLSIYLIIYLSIYPSIHPSIYLSNMVGTEPFCQSFHKGNFNGNKHAHHQRMGLQVCLGGWVALPQYRVRPWFLEVPSKWWRPKFSDPFGHVHIVNTLASDSSTCGRFCTSSSTQFSTYMSNHLTDGSSLRSKPWGYLLSGRAHRYTQQFVVHGESVATPG